MRVRKINILFPTIRYIVFFLLFLLPILHINIEVYLPIVVTKFGRFKTQDFQGLLLEKGHIAYFSAELFVDGVGVKPVGGVRL